MAINPDEVLDCSGLSCPMPILKTKKAIDKLSSGQVLKMIATDPGSKPDIDAWSKKTGHTVLDYQQEGNKHIFFIKKT
jgi:tRNA 2-thiouridine synthesizing protein A